MGQYLPIVALLVLVAAFAGISLIAQRILVPPRPNAAKVAPYECGILDTSEPPERFPVRFYLIAMIFIVFDIEIIFFYPFTQVYGALGWFGLVAIGIFTVAVFESFPNLIAACSEVDAYQGLAFEFDLVRHLTLLAFRQALLARFVLELAQPRIDRRIQFVLSTLLERVVRHRAR